MCFYCLKASENLEKLEKVYRPQVFPSQSLHSKPSKFWRQQKKFRFPFMALIRRYSNRYILTNLAILVVEFQVKVVIL